MNILMFLMVIQDICALKYKHLHIIQSITIILKNLIFFWCDLEYWILEYDN